ncbi:stage II sporulation protein M [Natronorubrum aibiense]|uniref:Stage II sporulation protein M n=1 Tax=Natronorubrum aibiense TaxID=348826 RepID=A0A5P9P0B5_9EURY|nr:stage II sporulation protein M [Natronorubrum aibiense]QFU81591.1 stage II sporulation protein M [Natronorubrum aibiense]
MALSDAVTAAVAVLRRRPADILPWYLLGASVPAVARVIPFFAFVIGAVYLEVTGRLATIRDELSDLETAPPDPNADPEAVEEWATGFEPVLDQLLTPGLVALVGLTFLTTLLVGVVLYAAVTAGQLSTCAARLRDERGLTAGLAGARRYWLRFLGLYALEILLWIVVFLTVGAGAALVSGLLVAATGSVLIAALVALPVGFVLVAALAVVRAVFAFAPVSVVVDDATVVGSLSTTVAFVRARPLEAGFYYVVSVGTLLAFSILSGVFTLVDVVAFPSLLTVFLVFPALDLLKTALYDGSRGRLSPPTIPDRSIRAQFRDGFSRGWTELTAFVRATLGTHAVVIALAVAGFWAGWTAAEPLVGTVETSISARLEGHIAPAAALEFFGNNWLVALTTALSGVVLAIPAIVSLLFNGVFMGVYARTEVAPMELLAFVVPHGIFEIPAIFIATVLGVHLGLAGWRTARGRATRASLADALERAFWVLVGVGILLAVAAVIEGFVSPYYFRLFL